MPMQSIIETARLRLRELEPDDVTDAYVSWLNDPEINRFLESRFAENTMDDVRRFVGQCRGREDTQLFGLFAEDGQHIGNIKIGPISTHHKRGEIGILIGEKSAWGKGFGREAIAGLANYAFQDLKLAKLTAGCYARNVGSRKAFRQAGFEEKAIRPAHFWCDDHWDDLVLMDRFASQSTGSGE
ncbi:GNAT family N-acetyltransferase [Hwanghaeella grinnelliae]|nr:GNAT family N-acetyltransferase [Hwanghaeella grinnelliae]